MIAREADLTNSSDRRTAGRKWIRVIPYLLALFFALWGLRGVGCNNIVETDAARHAMNGAFIHDYVRNGQLTSPVAYGELYYSRLPALSLPYHPPGFPMIEALFFFIFGVNVPAARLAVALCVFASVVLLYRIRCPTPRPTRLYRRNLESTGEWRSVAN